MNEVFATRLAEVAGLPTARLRVITRFSDVFSMIKSAIRLITPQQHILKVRRYGLWMHLDLKSLSLL